MTLYEKTIANFANSLYNDEALADNPSLQIYRNNINLNRSSALSITFPTVQRLLGNTTFNILVKEYITSPSIITIDSQHDGEKLLEFIKYSNYIIKIPYLADVAHLDWALHICHTAPDLTAISAQTLAKQIDNFEQMSLTFHPSMHLIESDWPIAYILNNPNHQDISIHNENVLVWRDPLFNDRYQTIPFATATFIRSLLTGKTVAQAFEATMLYAEPFCPKNIITLLIEQALIHKIKYVI